MTIVKISDLPAANSPVSPSDVTAVVQGGITKKAALNQLGFLASGTGASPRTMQDKMRDIVSTKDYGAVGDGVTDDTAALTNAMASGKIVDGLGLTYKVTPNVIIDPYATAGVGYGPDKAWFCVTSRIQNMKIIGSVSFGNFFLGKHLEINKIEIDGDCRFSSWYTTYQGMIVNGTVYIGGDVPPNQNFNGFYVNSFVNCAFNGPTIVDERYGPVNANYFECVRFNYFLVRDTGNAGYNPSTLPAKSFHLNLFATCEFYTDGVQANDGDLYAFVILDNANTDGINRFINCYMESSARGFYGPGLEVDNLHTSGFPQGVTIGGNSASNARLGYQSPLSGEGGYVNRDVPNIYPMGSIATGGDWSILNSSGFPPCFTSNNATPTVGTDATEPTGLGKYVQYASSAPFGEVRINLALTPINNNEVYSYAIVYKTIAGSVTIIDRAPNNSENFGTANIVKLTNGWVMATGHCRGQVVFQSAGLFTVRISAVSCGRGSGLISPYTVNKPLIDLTGGSSYLKDGINATGVGFYNNQQTKTMNVAGGNYDFYRFTLNAFSGQSLNLRANFSLASTSGGTRYFYRESVLMIDGSNVMQETNLHNITGSNGSLSFALSNNTITVRATSSAAVDEIGRMAVNAFGNTVGASIVTVL